MAAGPGRADRAVGRARRRRRPGAGSRQCRHGAVAGAPVGPAVSGFVLHRIAARRLRRRRNLYPGRHAAGRRGGAAGGGHPSGAVPGPRRVPGARGARVHRRRRDPRQSAAGAALHAGPIPAQFRGNGAPLRRRALGAGQYGRDRAALQPDPGAGQAAPAELPHAGRRDAGRLPGPAVRGRPGKAPAVPVPRRGRAQRQARPVLRTPALGVQDHHPDGLSRLLPDRAGLHQLGQEQRRSGRAGAGLGRRLAGGLRAGHYRPGSDPLRLAVRALPESGAGVDA
ncbi:Uncharacterised protein [Bordetella pertussis]|nr:Uncharacterised protein [Bordetella pertussis]